MARVAPIITSFAGGQMSRTLDGRVDFEKYPNACKLLQNAIALIQGPAQRRGGSAFVTEHKDSSKRVWGIRFEFSADQSFVIEFGDQYIRFLRSSHEYIRVSGVAAWSNAVNYVVGDLVSRLGVNYYCFVPHINQQPPNATYWYPLTGDIYEIPSPYVLANLTNADGTCALKTEQSGDVLYIANQTGIYPALKLTRFADTNWQTQNYLPNQGPFQALNGTAITLQASAVTGNITLTASSALFVSTDVFRLVRLESQDLTTKPWQGGIAYALNAQVRSDGKTYRALNAATSGPNPPTHEQGSAFDGVTGVSWQYINSGYGIVRISGFTSSTSVSAFVIVDEPNGYLELPADVVSATTKRWQLGEWSFTTGFPRAVTFWLNRLVLTGRQKIWASVPNDFENHTRDFFGVVQVDNALNEQVQSQDVNDILWVLGQQDLLLGTSGGEFRASKITQNDPVGPGNLQVVRSSKRRVRAVQPPVIGTSVIYVQRAGRKILSLDYDFDVDNFKSLDLSVLSNLITRGQVIEMAYQSEPDSILWVLLKSGKLLGLTYDAEQNVTAWHTHQIGGNGFVESIVTISADGGDREELWMSVRRTINGQTKRYWEYLKKPWEGPDDEGNPGDDQVDAFYVDSGVTYDGAPATTITGLSHLEGETVQVFSDGAVHPDRVVTGGEIELTQAASVVHVGLQSISRIVPMRIEAGSQDGTAQGKPKRVHKITLRFVDTLGGKVGPFNGTLDSISTRDPSTPMGQPQPFFSGDVTVDYPGAYETDGLVEVRQDQPLPMMLAAIIPRMRTYDP